MHLYPCLRGVMFVHYTLDLKSCCVNKMHMKNLILKEKQLNLLSTSTQIKIHNTQCTPYTGRCTKCIPFCTNLALHCSVITRQLFSNTISMFQIELASGKFPYAASPTPFEQLKQVVKDPPPKLPADKFSPEFEDFISKW